VLRFTDALYILMLFTYILVLQCSSRLQYYGCRHQWLVVHFEEWYI